MSEMSLLAPIPHKSRERADKRMIAAMSDIARRVAMKAMSERKPDVFLEVYAAGLAHAVTLGDRSPQAPAIIQEPRCPICEDRAHPCERCPHDH